MTVVFENSAQVELQQIVDEVTALGVLGKGLDHCRAEAPARLAAEGQPSSSSKQEEFSRARLPGDEDEHETEGASQSSRSYTRRGDLPRVRQPPSAGTAELPGCLAPHSSTPHSFSSTRR